ncbi:MAG TPA: condensation domain-containing protein, partial [Roseiflexaceae bacterium]|nr:condensation domain-containing protein [Roseiflexaceae bacterium]
MTTLELLARLRELGIKLWTEGDRLRFQAPKGALTPELRDALVEHKAEVIAFLHEASVATQEAPAPILPAQHSGDLPLSFAQQRLWFLDQLQPGSPLYNIPSAVRLLGRLDVDALRRSMDTIVQRHAVLRTTFATVGQQPVQVIAPASGLALDLLDLRDVPPDELEPLLERYASDEARLPFDLHTGPLVRARLLRAGDEEHVLLVTMHHIISDGWSISVIMRELAILYTAFAAGRPSPLPDLPIQYADFALWQRDWLDRPDASGESPLQRQIGYWKQQLGGAPAAIELPADRPRPPVQTFGGAKHQFEIPAELGAALNALSKSEGASLFMTLLAAFQLLLARHSGQDDIVVGTPIANRTRPEIEPLIGFFVNTLVLRTTLAGNPSFRELLARVRETTLAAYANQDVPFERLVEELKPPRDLSRNPLFLVMLVLQNLPSTAIELPGLTLRPETMETATAKFDLELGMVEAQGRLLAEFNYNTDLFEDATIVRMAGHFQTLLAGIAADPDRPVRLLPLLSGAERRTFAEWNTPPWPLPPSQCLHELVAGQAARTPDATALVVGTQRL